MRDAPAHRRRWKADYSPARETEGGILLSVSERDVEIVRRAFTEFTASQRLTADHAPDLVWNMGTFEGWPGQREFLGAEGFYEFIREWTQPFEDWRLIVEEIRDAGGGRVAAIVRQSARPHGSASSVELPPYAMLYTVIDGQIRRIDLYRTPEQALAAVRSQDL